MQNLSSAAVVIGALRVKQSFINILKTTMAHNPFRNHLLGMLRPKGPNSSFPQLTGVVTRGRKNVTTAATTITDHLATVIDTMITDHMTTDTGRITGTDIATTTAIIMTTGLQGHTKVEGHMIVIGVTGHMTEIIGAEIITEMTGGSNINVVA